MQYRREIDGLRAVAVLPVILFHAGFAGFSGGFIGVDVFFVISGYLIITLLIEDLESDRFSIWRFYDRRARRILPSLILVTFATAVAALTLMTPTQLKGFSESLIGVSTFTSNYVFWGQSGYFAEAAEKKPLLHTWSLGVEEQFYFLAPLCLFLVWKYRRNWMLAIAIVLAISSFAISQYGVRYHQATIFFFTPTRAWELLAGVICALLIKKNIVTSRPLASLCGLVLILVSVVWLDNFTPTPSLYSLPAVLGASLVILFGSDTGIAGRILSSRTFVAIGLISYSAYLWHQPLFALARVKSRYVPSDTTMALLTIATLILAGLTWKYIEGPVRFASRRAFRVDIACFFAAFAAMFLLGVVGSVTDGFESSYVAGLSSEKKAIYSMVYKEHNEPSSDISECNFRVSNFSPDTAGRLNACFNERGQGIALIGDSHAIGLYGALSVQARDKFIFGLSRGSCRAHDTRGYCSYDAFLTYVKNHPHAFKKVIYEQAGFYLFKELNGQRTDRDSFEKRVISDYPLDKTNIGQVVGYLRRLSKYTATVWLGPHIEPHYDFDRLVSYGCKPARLKLRKGIATNFQRLDNYLQKLILADSTKSLVFRSQMQLINFDMTKDFTDCNNLYWKDSDHWSEAGQRRFGKRLIPLLESGSD